jgi:hypothetical protein
MNLVKHTGVCSAVIGTYIEGQWFAIYCKYFASLIVVVSTLNFS